MDIVFTGEGIVSAIGIGKAETLEALLDGRSGIGGMRFLRSVHTELPVGEVPASNEELKERLGFPAEAEVSRSVLLGVEALRQALAEARVPWGRTEKNPGIGGDESGCNGAEGVGTKGEGSRGRRIALVCGATVGGMDITERHLGDIRTTENPEFMRYHDCGASTGRIADYFGIFSECTTISTACSSAANALILGAEMLRSGEADMVVAGGTEPLSLFHLNGFNSLMILDHELCRPFDADRAGLNLGEGAAFLVMESAESAARRGCPVHGYLTGWGNACDAFHQTASSEDGEGAFLAMREALGMAGLRPGDIQYVNAHGTGTPNNDLSETAALRRVFGSSMPRVSSTKAFTGHTTSASGAIEAVICLLAIKHGFVPANLRWERPMQGGIVPSAGETGAVLDNVLSNSFGFGGNDSALVLSRRPCSAGAGGGTARLPDSSAATVEDLVQSLEERGIRVAGRAEVTCAEQLEGIRKWFSPMEARRMGKLMKAAMTTSLEALEAAGIGCPDAIVTGTDFGCIENSERLLMRLGDEGETLLSPTYFMQSTHNTIAGSLAIKTGCHGRNLTYTQRGESGKWALREAERLLLSGRRRNVLVELHDEGTPLFRSLMERLGMGDVPEIHSVAMVLSCGK